MQRILLFNKIFYLVKTRLELLCWLAAMIALFFLPVGNSEQSLCVFRFIGFERCPGCGLGHAIHSALHFQFVQSFHEHIFGIPAVLIILNRIKELSFSKKITTYES